MKNIRKVLADNLRRLMESSQDCRDQPELQAKSGVGQATISRILNEHSATSIEIVADLARALKVQPWELLVDDEATREAAFKRILGRQE